MQIALLGLGILASRHMQIIPGSPSYKWELIVHDVDLFAKRIGSSSEKRQQALKSIVANMHFRRCLQSLDALPLSDLLRELYRAASRSSRWTERDQKLFCSYIVDTRDTTRIELKRIVKRWAKQCPAECAPISELLRIPAIFLPLSWVEPAEATVVDLCVPEVHEFVANGFVCYSDIELNLGQ